MKYTKSLSKLTDITDMKIIHEMYELDKLTAKIREFEDLKSKLKQELEEGKLHLQELINSAVSKISDYYKIRSAISALSSKLLVIETRIESVDENIEEVKTEALKVNEKVSFLRKKKKKFEKLLSEGL